MEWKEVSSFAYTLQPPHLCRGWNTQRWMLKLASASLNQDDLLTRDKHLRCEASQRRQDCQKCHLGSRAQGLLSTCWLENDRTKAAESHRRDGADLTQAAIFQVLEIKQVAWGPWWGSARRALSFLSEHRMTFLVSLKVVTSSSKRLFVQPLHCLFSVLFW